MASDILQNAGLGEDPGWQNPSNDPLVLLRRLFLAFCIAVVGVGVVAMVVGDVAKDSASPTRPIAIIAAIGCASLAIQPFVRRTLDCTSNKTLAVSYRERFFLRVALSEAVALAACAMSLSWGPRWVFFVGAAFTVVGFWRLAPTRRHLQQDQDRLSLSGCLLSLVAALRSSSLADSTNRTRKLRNGLRATDTGGDDSSGTSGGQRS